MRIFAEGRLRAALDARIQALREEVYAEIKNRLLNVNEKGYVD